MIRTAASDGSSPSVPHTELPRYDPAQTYRWNYDHAPVERTRREMPSIPGHWTYCGRPVPSPLGVAAGPLLNGRWILYYAALGFDVLTYKTVRSKFRECYPLPNLQPVEASTLRTSGTKLVSTGQMEQDWAVSFGMPSMDPATWQADVEWTRRQLAPEKLLSVSVVASAEPDWSVEQLAADFAQCARWAKESGADCVEANFSCPNVATVDGQLFQQPELAAVVAHRVREAIGKIPLIIKIGLVESREQTELLLAALAPFADALAMTNCISAFVQSPDGTPLFQGQQRGIGGPAIRAASVEQVSRFQQAAKRQDASIRILGVGGISTAEHVREYLQAGAEAVQLATAIMTDPLVGQRIRSSWE